MDSVDHEIKRLLEDIEKIIKVRNDIWHPCISSTDWRTYHQKRAYQIKLTMKSLKPIIDLAVSSVLQTSGRGRKPAIDTGQKITILLVQRLLGKSNRGMAYMLLLFSSISGKYLGYKSVERFYSDQQVYKVLLKLQELLLEINLAHN